MPRKKTESEGNTSSRAEGRRQFLKKTGTLGATISTGVVGLSGISIARPIGPDDPKAHSTHQTRDLGSHYYYDERIVDTGSRVEFVDSTFLAGKWNFVYRTSAATYSIDHKPSTDESKKAGVITGGEGFTIKELDNPRQVSTSISGNADWGLGVKSPNNYNNNWSNAAKNTITALISYFSPAVGAIATAAQIVNYWKEAAKPTGSHADVVGNYWNFWDPSGAKTDSLGHYVEYTHKVPPREEYGKDYFDSTIRNSQNNNMNQIDNYVKTFGLSMYINSSPNNMSTSEQKKYGVEKVPAAKSRAAMLSDQELDPDEPVYIARNPTVKIEEL